MAYVAPIHRPSSVKHAIKLSFLSPGSEDLIVAKGNRIEIYSSNPDAPDQLVCLHKKSIYGKVNLFEKIRPATSPTDHLFVGTDRLHYFTLSWNPQARELKTEKSAADVFEKAARDSQTGDRVHIDPSNRFMALYCHEGIMNIIPITQANKGKGKRRPTDTAEIGELGDAVSVRIPELNVRSSCFLHKRHGGPKPPNPEIALLYEDSQRKVHVSVRELEFTPSLNKGDPADAELEKSKKVQGGHIEFGASHLIPLPKPMYGMLIIAETSITYVDEWEHEIKNRKPLEEATDWTAWCAIDEQRYALADNYGRLYLLFVEQSANGEYANHQLDLLGNTSRASTLVYLGSARVFLGSHQGDSQILQISEKSVEVLQQFENIAPILDFTVMDMGNRTSDAPVNEFSSGQARIVTGSGAWTDGSLRSVRSGVGLEDLGSIGELGESIVAMFSLRNIGRAKQQAETLIVSFVGQTRAFVFDEEGQVEEVERFGGFEMGESTLYASDLPAEGGAVQVTSSAVYLTDADNNMVASSWSPPNAATITDVSVNGRTVLLSLGGASLVVLDLANATISQTASIQLSATQQVSCIHISPALPNACVVGFWQDSQAAVLDLQTLKPIVTERVADEDSIAVPRSLLIANILEGAPPTLFVGLADGNVVTYSILSADKPFTSRKSMILGTQQATFAALPRNSNGLQNVFASCEHPSLIYGADGRMVYSAITASAASTICSFDTAAYPGAIAIGTETGELKLAIVDEERNTHVQTLRVDKTVRRIAYSTELKAFGLGTIRRVLVKGEEIVSSHFQLVDEIAFQELHTFQLNEEEIVDSVMRCKLPDGSSDNTLEERFVVGTSYMEDPDVPEDPRGRILIFSVTESRQLKLVYEKSTRGACRCLAYLPHPTQPAIVAALIKTVVAFTLDFETPSTPTLTKRAVYRAATAPIDLAVNPSNNNLAITDLMKSLSLLQYTPPHSATPAQFTELARHHETLWTTAVTPLSPTTYLVADSESNLVVLEHIPPEDAYDAADARRLRVISELSLGEAVNRLYPLNSQNVLPSPSAVVIPAAFIATIDGSLYLFGTISPSYQNLLMQLQDVLANTIKSPGEVEFRAFRGVRTSVRDMSAEGPQRFVDGELVERFLDLDAEAQETVVAELGGAVGVEEVRVLVEGLRRMH
ncbi:hypothetical protein MBLNU230_g3002t1 [Neophaeotheca triangularis]